MCKISLIVPCYNVEKYLPRCLDSLVSQTLQEIEVICINDGSPDRCIDILQNYKKEYSDKIVVIDKKNEGVWRGRQDAIALAKGEYIGFVDSDDYVAPDMCESLYRCASDSGADIAVSGFYRVDADSGKVLNEEMTDPRKAFSVKSDPVQLLQLNGAPWNKIFKAHLLKDMYDFKNPPKIFDDMMMHLLVYPFVDKVAFVPKPLVYYGIRNDSIMTTISKEKVDSTYRCMREVKTVYRSLDVSPNLIEFLDLSAGLHLGVSLMFRLAYDKSANLRDVISENDRYLDQHFSTWRTANIPSNSKAMRKIKFARTVRCSGQFLLALKVYRAMVDKLGIDIKW